MKLPRFTATTTPPRLSGLARATDIAGLTQTGEIAKLRGLGAFGRGMERAGEYLFKAQQDRQAIDASIQHDKATSTMNMAHDTNLAEASGLLVASPAEREKIMEGYGKNYDTLSSATLKGIDNSKGRDLFRQTTIGLKSRQMTAIYGALTATLDQQQKLDKKTLWEGLLLNAPVEDIEATKKSVAEDIRRHLPLFGAAEVKSLITNLDALTNKLRTEKTIKDTIDLAAIKPNLVKSYLDTELKARAAGKKALDEFALLSNSDLEYLRDYTNSVGERATSESKININAAIVDAYSQIRDGDIDIDRMIDAIEARPDISDEDKIQAAEKIPTYFNKINSTKVAEESNNDIYDMLVQATASQERGSISPAAFEELYADNKEFLTSSDQRDIRSKDIVATKTMQNRSFSEVTTNNISRLMELREDELSGLIAARDNALVIKDLKTVNALNFSIKKAQIQKWNYGRFRTELRSQIAANEEWSQKQIFVAGDVLVDAFDKPIGDLMVEFERANPNRSILGTPPDDDFNDIWEGLSIEDKAKVWELRLAGATVKEILGAI